MANFMLNRIIQKLLNTKACKDTYLHDRFGLEQSKKVVLACSNTKNHVTTCIKAVENLSTCSKHVFQTFVYKKTPV